ncbi:Sulfatase [Trichormus variabilis ATCC 29413]|uniref:Sulfatase n=2 Tax=Anabaena variabilis TaxID=264691 RepID=Q3MGZ9_TRIV2|nr:MULTISPECIES: arylsulfatase [Nostocaceae]ABA19737.1 Sulfatase [Trichormus variabilis ATCC 29413]MBC1214734.1 arylsulfatase [Trichormus variabilis ARAD]MBC1257856.1 arylsulfatase [Trichormus variabilis V5]MBC1267382.1 arylsulfatase [Trichormus variabilis FSR]MBC1303070.1 arylsulfatase [Trichormus variabilis N2B]
MKFKSKNGNLFYRIAKAIALSLLITLLMVNGPALAATSEVLPLPLPAFKGKIGLTYKESQPDFPQPITAPANAPNVLLVILDDVGFGQASTFGGPVDTPNLTHLAETGLRYNQFHTTALCSPTRAALLTGRNHHSVNTGVVEELATGYPGYTTVLPKSAATVAEILRQNGYNTAAFGKWHNTPDFETSAVGPFDRWPTGLGFEYFYGFLGGDTNQWSPALVENTKRVDKPNKPDYHLTPDLVDHAIAWIRNQQSIAPEKPFFAYLATGATHAPHHAPKEWIDKYQGKFDQGWDKLREETFARQKQLGVIPANAQLTPRPPELPAWDSLSAEQQKLYAHMAEVFAGFLAHTDYEVGRLINAVDQLGELDNTLVIYVVGDNGASAEGGLTGSVNELQVFNAVPENLQQLLAAYDDLGSPKTFNHFPAAWAWAVNTPFQWTKQIASHFGGTRNPLVISWGANIKDQGGIRSQFHHVIDITPTILEVAGITVPKEVNGVKQRPIEGTSLAYTFNNPNAPSHRETQYFEMLGNRAIYDEGWVAAARHGRLPWERTVKGSFDTDEWELYNIAEDFSEANNLAKKNPQKLEKLQKLFLKEAKKHNVLPLDDRIAERFDVKIRPSLTRGRTTFTYYPGTVGIPEGSAPNLKNRSFTITANVEVPEKGAEGVILTQGGRFAGWSFFLEDNKPTYVYNYANTARYTIQSPEKLPSGKSTIRFNFDYDGGVGAGGIGKLFINDQQVAEGRVDKTIAYRLALDETFDVGRDTGTPVVDTYQVPFNFTGNLQQVSLDLK